MPSCPSYRLSDLPSGFSCMGNQEGGRSARSDTGVRTTYSTIVTCLSDSGSHSARATVEITIVGGDSSCTVNHYKTVTTVDPENALNGSWSPYHDKPVSSLKSCPH
ncbi:hypothetical protein DICA4_D26632 [Diutina catenulata]